MVGNQNPLRINLILENVLQCLNVEDLKSSRLVCKEWNYEATLILKKSTARVSFSGGTGMMKRFLDMASWNENTPFVKFIFSPNAFSSEQEELLQRFFKIFGPTVESISLSVDKDSDSNQRIPSDLIFPKLKHLDLSGHSLDAKNQDSNTSTREPQEIPNIFPDLLRAAPNLVHLGFWFDIHSKESVKFLFKVIFLEPPKRLKQLDLSLPLGDAQLEILSRFKLKLRTLTCDFNRSCFDKDSLKSFLSTQRTSLEYLKIDNYFGNSCYTLEFPVMENLKTLKIDGRRCQARCDVTFLNFSYAKQFPGLRTLILGGCIELNNCWREIFPENARVHSVQHVKLTREFIDPAWIRRIACIFPNLRKLKIWYSPKNQPLIQAVFKGMRNLDELTISFPSWIQSGNVDYILTGIPKSRCKMILKKMDQLPANFNDLATKISITNLSNLKTLIVKGLEGPNAFITDVTVGLALLQMKSLKCLTTSQSQISEEYIQILRSNLHLTLLTE